MGIVEDIIIYSLRGSQILRDPELVRLALPYSACDETDGNHYITSIKCAVFTKFVLTK